MAVNTITGAATYHVDNTNETSEEKRKREDKKSAKKTNDTKKNGFELVKKQIEETSPVGSDITSQILDSAKLIELLAEHVGKTPPNSFAKLSFKSKQKNPLLIKTINKIL